MQDLQKKYELYLNLIKQKQDPLSGFIEAHECDSLLFTGLTGCVPGVKVSIYSAFEPKTKTWRRRPLHLGQCYDPTHPQNRKPFWTRFKEFNKSRKDKHFLLSNGKTDWERTSKLLLKKSSTISRDMLTGLAWYAWHNKKLDISEQVISYALKNWGMMGEGDITRINILPGMFSTFCWISYKLGGPSRAWARWIPGDTGNKGLIGYQAHLQVLHILLRKELEGRISSNNKKALQAHAAREPKNPLFQHSVGENDKAIEILSDVSLWPEDRLPNSKDRKEPWILQRDHGKDWKPCMEKEEHTHSGGDFIFVYYLIQRKYLVKF